MQKGSKLGSSKGTCQIFPSQTFQTLNISSSSAKAELGQRLIYISTLGLYINDRDMDIHVISRFDRETILYIMHLPNVLVCCWWLVHTHQKGLKINPMGKYQCVGHHATEDSPWSAAVMAYSTKLWFRVQISGECKLFNSRVTISSISEITRETRCFQK